MEKNTNLLDKVLFEKLIHLYNIGKHKELEEKLIFLIKTNAKSYSLFNLLGAVKKSLNDFVGSQIAFKKAININPKNSEGHNNLGLLYLDMRKFDQAITTFNVAINLNPKNYFFYNNLGIANLEKNLILEAKINFQNALEINPNFLQSINNLGITFAKLRQLEDAIFYFNKAININPKFTDAYLNLADIYSDLGNIESAIKNCELSLELNSNLARAQLTLGNLFKNINKDNDAIKAYEKALTLDPNNYTTYNNLANVFVRVKRLDEAINFYKKAFDLNKECMSALSSYIFQKMSIFDWSVIKEFSGIKDIIGITGEAISPFFTLTLEDNPKNQMMRSINWSESQFKIASSNIENQKIIKNKKISIGYFSSDFYDHATLYLISGLLNSHDKNLFEINLFSYGNPPESELFKNIIKNVDHFMDISKMKDSDVVSAIRNIKLDIAIDLKGYTFGSRSKLFSYKLAPIQINFLGYPGTMGCSFIDYIVADKVIIDEKTRKNYMEKVLYMPNSYQPNDNLRKINQSNKSKKDFGLPENSFVICCFNSPYKITNEEFKIWLEVLHEIKDSVLWLLDVSKSAKFNLNILLDKYKIDQKRIIFAKNLSHSSHLERLSYADIFVDTFNYNAHTTCSDALWSGVPVITKKGKQFSARVAASLLSAIEMNELIVENIEDYKNLILDLSKNKDKLLNIRKKLFKNIPITALFDTKKYTRDFEKGLSQIYLNRLNKLEDIDIQIK